MQQIQNDLIFSGRGSTALYAILKSLNTEIRKILIPVNICEIVIPVVQLAGFTPIFYDVCATTGNSNLDHIKDKYTGNETVLMAVHNFGAPLEIDQIADWALRNSIFLIEDVCNSVGAVFKNISVGNWGDAAIFSFGYSKIIDIGIGGGAIVKDSALKVKAIAVLKSLEMFSTLHKQQDQNFQNRLRELRKNSENQNPEIYTPLYKEYVPFLLYQIDELTQSTIREAFKRLNAIVELRAKKALMYREGITSEKILHIPEVNGQIYWRYNILVEPECRDELLKLLISHNIWASTWYPPVNKLFFEDLDSSNFTGANSFSKRVINLFVEERFSVARLKRTISLINQF